MLFAQTLRLNDKLKRILSMSACYRITLLAYRLQLFSIEAKT